MSIKKFFSQIMCNHYDATYLCTVKKGNGFDDALLRCNDCGKIIEGYNKPHHIIEGFRVDLQKPGHVKVSFDNGKSVSVHYSLIVENVKKGFWEIGKNAFNVSWMWMHEKSSKKVLDNMDKSDIEKYGSTFNKALSLLSHGSAVTMNLKDGKILLSMISSFMGYDNARSKYRWEKDEVNDKMTFKVRGADK